MCNKNYNRPNYATAYICVFSVKTTCVNVGLPIISEGPLQNTLPEPIGGCLIKTKCGNTAERTLQ